MLALVRQRRGSRKQCYVVLLPLFFTKFSMQSMATAMTDAIGDSLILRTRQRKSFVRLTQVKSDMQRSRNKDGEFSRNVIRKFGSRAFAIESAIVQRTRVPPIDIGCLLRKGGLPPLSRHPVECQERQFRVDNCLLERANIRKACRSYFDRKLAVPRMQKIPLRGKPYFLNRPED